MIVLPPKVSIIIPVYNGANYMREAIDSALAQTYSFVEILVINDGSKDNGETERIALSYGSKIRYFYKPNGGVATALNKGIEEMTGKYFSWLSHDDLYTPDKIEKQIRALTEFGETAIAYSNFCYISATRQHISDCEVSPKGEHSMRSLLAIGTEVQLHGCTLLIPKKFFDQYGTFNPKLKYTQDYDVWFRFAGNVPFIHVRETLVLSRQHEEQDSKTKGQYTTPEADLLHKRLIGDLSASEVDTYCMGSIDYLISAFYLYRNAGYEKTSLQLLKHVFRLAMARGQEDKIKNLLNEVIFMSDDINKISLFKKQTLSEQTLSVRSSRKTKPRILVYQNVWFRGGVERVVSTVMNHLSDEYDWVIVSSDKELDGGFYLNDGITHIKLSEAYPEKLSSRLAALSLLIDADLFIGHPNIMFDLLKVYELLRDLNIKTIACNHGYYFLPYHYAWLYPIIDYRLDAYKHANAVTWLTSFNANIYAQNEENSALMPNPNTFDVQSSIALSDKKVILCVGRFYDAVKRLDRMLEVFAKVLVLHPDATLVLIGGYNLDMHIPTDSRESVKELMRRLSIPLTSITFAGEQDEVGKYYSSASLLMVTSDSEGFCMVLTEAGTFGLPSVLFEIPGLDDIISDGENGYIVPQDDITAMAEKVCSLLSDLELRVRMGENALRMTERFSREAICSRWKNLIDAVLSIIDQDALNEYLKQNFVKPPLDEKSFRNRVIREYEKNIGVLLKSKKPEVVVQTIEKIVHVDTGYCLHCSEMEKSLSWRVTKPLRLSKKFYVSIRESGVVETGQKVKNKIKRKLNTNNI